MLIKTLLNKVERFKSFVYGSICVEIIGDIEALAIDIVTKMDENGTFFIFKVSQYSPRKIRGSNLYSCQNSLI
jgi:hypothetical protein